MALLVDFCINTLYIKGYTEGTNSVVRLELDKLNLPCDIHYIWGTIYIFQTVHNMNQTKKFGCEFNVLENYQRILIYSNCCIYTYSVCVFQYGHKAGNDTNLRRKIGTLRICHCATNQSDDTGWLHHNVKSYMNMSYFLKTTDMLTPQFDGQKRTTVMKQGILI